MKIMLISALADYALSTISSTQRNITLTEIYITQTTVVKIKNTINNWQYQGNTQDYHWIPCTFYITTKHLWSQG